jgi:hypothetical protein
MSLVMVVVVQQCIHPSWMSVAFKRPTTLENFARKTCYDYFQAYDVTLICSPFIRILYSSYMLYYIKKRIGNMVKNCTKTISYL